MTLRSVALPMYDWDRGAVQAWWAVLADALRARGVDGVPATLQWPADLQAHWHDPALLLSQTCGLPLVTSLRGVVQVVGAFCYTAPGCAGLQYSSRLVVRQDDVAQHVADLAGRVAVVNDPGSYSGCSALLALVAPFVAPSVAPFVAPFVAPLRGPTQGGRFFGGWVVSGAHRQSLHAVHTRQADVAAIDCVTLAGWQRERPRLLDGLRVLASTPLAPGLPLVTAAGTSAHDLARLRLALAAACSDPAHAALREALFIGGFTPADADAWLPIEAARQRASAVEGPASAVGVTSG